MGHTFPGAAAPFGMVQLSPETNQQEMFVDGQYNRDTYKYCSGYQYSDNTIFGFSHTHFSGTGHSDLGDFLIMPTTGVLNLEPGVADETASGYHSTFSHKNEYAEPGYYSVLLNESKIKAELTASERVGFHSYTFSKSDTAHIILDLMSNIYNYDDKNVWTFVRVENDSLVTGYRQTSGWARTRTVYFAMQFSKAFSKYGHKKYDKVDYNGFYRRFNETENFPEMAGKNIRAYFDFDVEENEKVKIKFALSSVSTEGALKNLDAEIPHWDFNKVKKQTQEKWNRELSKIEIVSQSPEDKVIFYTALYHTMLSPIIYEDVDGNYRGLDQNIHQSDGFINYTIFSLWDTFRALHPLFNLIQPGRNVDMIKSMLAHHDQSVHNMLPIWSHYSNENWCMIGYHSVSVIADAIAKGNTNFDINHALDACKNTSTNIYFDGLDYYMCIDFIPEDVSSNSVSKTLEFSYDDWCISRIANGAKKYDVLTEYEKRSQNFVNLFNESSGFMQPKLSTGSWKPNFDPLNTHGQGFIEGNAWTYSLFVPHEIDKMIEMMGGKNQFSERLDSLFTMQLDDKYIAHNEDITRDGIIGNYVHGNEPGHHIPYLYNWTGHDWKTQERVRMIMETMYGNKADGLCGNDDAGQMSAWYVFSALGFYPVCPGSGKYAIGSPLVKNATVNLENGKSFQIKTKNQSQENVYISKIILNGKELKRNYILHSEIVRGGEIIFNMTNKPI
ncbi:Glycosyl hydrolase family 92 [Candidatus Venteria ishoeyi]|uniref:Glycosyl hydrolase family 92 n=1 Tax=Candidatus Venteria ishoeyi TaxID=1899563 RepID=A0A1H6FBZ6_9GAMM|nr:Glycosyl hydrolase family 92 [Candidatus Venteria ishoeyi]SEH08567.1 Glycosyl hydrolase family 92 [Candidatus Venteria ishoeyi]